MKRARYIQSVMGVTLLFFPACSNKQDNSVSLYVLSVLDKRVYDDCHIKGSTYVPLSQLKFFVSTLDKDKEIILYCGNYMCGSSLLAYKQLTFMGFTRVKIYEGGTAEWYQRGYPVEGPCAEQYLKVVIDRPIASDQQSDVRTITADQLYKKLYGSGGIAKW